MRNTYLQQCDYGSRFRILKGGKIALVVSAFIAGTTLLHAAPSGGVVTSGTANIVQNGTITNITQASQKASINWNDFNIKAHETVNFNQPNASAITLNRVVGNERSVIDGALNANGQVWLLNSNGVLFGKNASINTAGLLATTSQLSDADFNAGNYNFSDASSNSVLNLGTITISDKGYAILSGKEVENQGSIKAVLGKVHLVGAEQVSINLNGNSLLNLRVDKGTLDSIVKNSGSIKADGGEVYLTTNAVDELLKGVVNNTGIIEAESLGEMKGKIELFAHGGVTHVDGTLDATGGFIETSGKSLHVEDSTIIKTKKWLLDPDNMTIQSTGGDVLTGESVSATAIQNALSTADIELQATTNIAVNENITWSTDKQLKLSADSINVNKTIENTNTTNGGVFFNAANTNDKIIFDATTGKVIVHNINQLQWMNTALAGNYELGSNIDASVTSGWNGGKGWIPIGVIAVVGMDATPANPFKGNFDGLGHAISNLYINDNMKSGAGLFGATNGATIKNINLTTVNITANQTTGGLVGQSLASTIQNASVSGTIKGGDKLGGLVGTSGLVSSISNSYSTATIGGNTPSYGGGLVGINSGGSTIENSYATGSVSGGNNLGGLVGQNDASTIKNSYATGGVAGLTNVVGGLVGSTYGASEIINSYASSTGVISGTGNLGGLVGISYGGTITNSYYDNQANAIAMGDSATLGKTKAELLTLIGGTGTGAIWGINGSQVSGYTTDAITLPFLKDVTKFNTLFQSGFGDSTNPYTITNWTQLQNINYNSNVLTGNYFFSLSSNLSSLTSDYTTLASATANSNKGWIPIGNNTNNFKGTFDGLNHTISDLYIKDNTRDFVGLFGFTNNATIKNIGLVNVDITGEDYVGGLVGVNGANSTITNSYATGEVTGTTYVGGLVGYNDNASTITNSYATGKVSGTNYVGGLAGVNASTITNSYATGEVTGTSDVGGLVGRNTDSSSIANSYASGTVSGLDYFGGLVGWYNSSSITNSFYDKTKNSTGMSDGGLLGVTGLTTKEMSYGGIYKAALWDIVVDSAVTSTTPIRKYDGTKYVWAIAPLDLSYTLSDKSKTYDGQTQNLSDLYTNVFGPYYAFIMTGYKFQRSGNDVAGYKDAGTYDGIKVVSDGTNNFLTIKTAGSIDGKYVINKKALTITGTTATDKTYDGTTAAAATVGTLSGFVGSETVITTASGTFNDKDAGARTATFAYTLANGTNGGIASNYSLADTTASGTIAKAGVTVSGITAENKTYDGTTSATIKTGSIAYAGLITGEGLTVSSTGAFVDKEVGTGKTVNLSNIYAAVAGTDMNNYTITDQTTTTANITAAVTPPSGGGGTPPDTASEDIPDVAYIQNGTASFIPEIVSQSNRNQQVFAPQVGESTYLPSFGSGAFEIINGGVRLPDGIEQEFFVTKL